MKNIKRGEIYFAKLDGNGSEQKGFRPVLVVQNDVGNQYSPTVIVAALTSKSKKKLPTHISIPCENTQLELDSVVLLEQLRTIDKSRLQWCAGSVSPEKMQEINQAIVISLGLSA